MMKVSLYIRNHSSRKSEKAKPQKIYPMGTIYVLRYGTTWETLKGDHTYQTAKTAAMRKETDLFAGVVEKPSPKPKPKPKPDVRTLDEAVNIYLTTGKAAQENWRKHTMQCYTLALKLFRQSCGKVHLDEIDGDDLRQFKIFLRAQKTSVGKKIDPRTEREAGSIHLGHHMIMHSVFVGGLHRA